MERCRRVGDGQPDGPATVEMELYFSCLIRKKVRFGDQAHSREFLPVNRSGGGVQAGDDEILHDRSR